MKSSSLLLSYIYALTGAVLSGFIVFGGGVMERAGFSLIEILIIPNAMIIIILFWFVKRDIISFLKFPALAGFGYFLSCVLTQVGQYTPLFLGVSVSLTVFLLYTQPIWNILISTIFFKTKFTKNEFITTVLVIAGLLLLLSPWKDFSYSVLGVILALVGGVALAGWVILSSYFSKNEVKPITTSFFSNLYTSVPFIIMLPVLAKFVPNPEISSFSFDKSLLVLVIVLIYSLTVFIAAQLLLFNAAKKVNSIHLGLIMLLEPVVGALMDAAFLDTYLSWNIVIGGILIITANVVLIMKNAGD